MLAWGLGMGLGFCLGFRAWILKHLCGSEVKVLTYLGAYRAYEGYTGLL